MKRIERSYHVHSGFTIVELLVIIVIIAILATLSIVGYNNVRTSAIRETLRSDVQEAASQLEKERQKIGSYPANSATVNSGKGLIASAGNNIEYIKISDKAYCVMVSSDDNAIEPVYQVSGNTKVQNGPCPVTVANTGNVKNFVGSTSAGFANGTGTAAQFNTELGSIAVDDTGTIYVADKLNNRIRSVTKEGVVSTFAGSGVAGNADGTGTAAQFNGPCGIAVDGKGFVYVSDTNSSRIRKITPKGVVTTLAGGTSSGYAEGQGTTARFSSPCGLVAESSGVLYVADSNNNRIRKITTSGIVSTIAGSSTSGTTDATGASAQFNYPFGIARDNSGVLYVTDRNSNRIRKISTSVAVTTIASTGFNSPRGIAVNALGVVYVADAGNNQVKTISSTGTVTVLAGSGSAGAAEGVGTAAQFNTPSGVTVDRNGVVYATSSSMIRKVE